MDEQKTRRDLLDLLEQRVGGVGATAKLLGIPYQSSYAGYKSGKRKIPLYIERSVRAHLALKTDTLRSLQTEVA